MQMTPIYSILWLISELYNEFIIPQVPGDNNTGVTCVPRCASGDKGFLVSDISP